MKFLEKRFWVLELTLLWQKERWAKEDSFQDKHTLFQTRTPKKEPTQTQSASSEVFCKKGVVDKNVAKAKL